jgi:hypothetical protein
MRRIAIAWLIFACICLPSFAYAQMTGIGDGGSCASTTACFTVTSSVSAGKTVFIYGTNNEATTGSETVTDSESNTYTKIGDFNTITGTINNQAFYSVLTHSLTTSDVITYNINSSVGRHVWGHSLSGYGIYDSAYTAPVHDQSANPFTVTAAASGAVAGELNIGVMFGNNGTASQPSGWTLTPQDNINSSSMAAYFVNSGTTAQTFSAAYTGSFYGAIIFAFEPSTAAACPHTLTLMGVGC